MMAQKLHSLASPSTVAGFFSVPAIIFISAFPLINIKTRREKEWEERGEGDT
jgi:hypothetical protein